MYVSVALALSHLGEHPVMLTLIPVLANEQVDPLMRGNLALTISSWGDQSVVSALVEILSNKHTHQYVRQNIAEAISKLANSEETMDALATLLQTSEIADAVHHALWTISRRIGVRLFIPDDSKENKLEIVKW